MRGKVAKTNSGEWLAGITPAYAGKSTSFQKLPCLCQDHPRLCGEKRAAISTAIAQSGSPPPMRGKGLPVVAAGDRNRITPAYAGKRRALKEVEHDP